MLDVSQGSPNGLRPSREIANPGNVTYLISVAVRFRRWMAYGAIIGVVLGLVQFMVSRPSYETSARILLDFRRLAPISQNDLFYNMKLTDATVESQIVILNSDALARRVISALTLHRDPEFVPPPWFPLRILGWLGLVNATPTDEEAMEIARDRFAQRVRVSRIGVSYVLEIGTGVREAEKARKIANGLARAYLDDQLEAKQAVAKSANDWFVIRLNELNDLVQDAAIKVVEFRRANDIMLTDGKFVDEIQVQDIAQRLVSARNERIIAEAKVKNVEALLAAKEFQGAVSDEFRNPLIVSLRQKYFDITRRIAETAERFGANHGAVERAQVEKDQLRSALEDEFRKIADAFRSDATVARSREVSLQADLDALTRTSNQSQRARVELTQLQSVLQSYTTVRDNFMTKFAEASQMETFPITEARLVSEATAPAKPSSPKLTFSIVAGLGPALILAYLAALARDTLSRRARTRSNVEDMLGARCLGFVPRIDDVPASQLVSETVRHGSALFAETMRAVRIEAGIRQGAETGARVILVASAVPGEGASTIAANLAGLCAQSRDKVLLIDADLRDRTLSERIPKEGPRHHVPELPGAVLSSTGFGPHLLQLAADGNAVHPADIFATPRFGAFMQRAQRDYDLIVIDCPPLIAVNDARLLAEFVDHFLLVVAWNSTTLETLGEAMARTPDLARKLLGFLFSKVDLSELETTGDYSTIWVANYLNQTRRQHHALSAVREVST